MLQRFRGRVCPSGRRIPRSVRTPVRNLKQAEASGRFRKDGTEPGFAADAGTLPPSFEGQNPRSARPIKNLSVGRPGTLQSADTPGE